MNSPTPVVPDSGIILSMEHEVKREDPGTHAARTERRAAVVCLMFFLAGWMALLLPPLAGVDGMRGGYALCFVGIFTIVASFVAILFYRDRAGVAARMNDPTIRLAHWQYSADEWKEIVREEKGGNGAAVLGGFALAALFLLIGFIVFLFDPPENGLFLAIMGGLAVLFALVGVVSMFAHNHRADRARPEVLISQEGLWFLGVLYTWNRKGIARLEQVRLLDETPALLVFTLRQIGGGGRLNAVRYQLLEVAVPVPRGEEDHAAEIAAVFGMQQEE